MKPLLFTLATLCLGCSGIGPVSDVINCWPNGNVPPNAPIYQCQIIATCQGGGESWYEYASAPSAIEAQVCLQSLLAEGYQACHIICERAGTGAPNGYPSGGDV